MLSRIEKGETYPSAFILFKICKKLDIDMEYFFVSARIENFEYVKETIKTIRQAVQNKDYALVKELVTLEERNPTFYKNNDLTQFLLWHKGIVLYYVDKDANSAIKFLEKAIGFNKLISKKIQFFSEREFEIINTLAVIYSEINNNQISLNYFKGAKKILLQRHLKDDKILLRIHYNMAKVLTRMKMFHESIDLCSHGIKKCLDISSMYLYGELTYHLGYNYELMGLFKDEIKIIIDSQIFNHFFIVFL
jgi:transcriptional regulator with XRE-family HTH domain